MGNSWNRRLFLNRAGFGAAGIACGTVGSMLIRDGGRNEPPTSVRAYQVRDFANDLDKNFSDLAVAEGDPAEATRGAIELLGGMTRFVRRGERVVVKPNVGWDRTPIQAANTNPIVVATIVKLCLEAGAAEVLVTDNSCNDARRCFTRSGIWRSTEEAGGKVLLPAAHRFHTFDLGGEILGRMPVLFPAVRADRFINVAVAKHHGLSGFTGAMKNLYGVLGGRRNRLHQRIDSSIADLAEFIRATLTVMDATRVLLRNGPQGGDVDDTRAVNQVIASRDPVAVDAYGCTLVDISPDTLPYLAEAERRGLGTADVSRIRRRGLGA